jgi:thiosulfate/3-mercaptopyruvate sulfurtransferase
MPNAKNLPFPEVLSGGELKPAEELRDLFSQLIEKDQKIITSCGSGITACILTLAATVAGYENLAVYDGSWAEWGLPSKLPVVTG